VTRRTEKQLSEIDALEADFRVKLVEQLRGCAAGGHSLLFLVSSMRPESWPPTVRSRTADELFAAAEQILSLRAQHGLHDLAIPAARFRDACRRHVDLNDHHRPGPRRQAQLLLHEMGVAQ
jgi:hypothetical protein